VRLIRFRYQEFQGSVTVEDSKVFGCIGCSGPPGQG